MQDSDKAKNVFPKPTKDPHAVALGRKGGLVRVPKGTAKLAPAERVERARKAAQARWAKPAAAPPTAAPSE